MRNRTPSQMPRPGDSANLRRTRRSDWGSLVPSGKFLFCLAFFPSCASGPYHKIVRRVENYDPLALSTLVLQFERRRLIPILEDVGVMLKLIDCCQFDSMAFELNGGSHFPAGVPTTNVIVAATHTPGRIRRPNLAYQRTTRFGQSQLFKPGQ